MEVLSLQGGLLTYRCRQLCCNVPAFVQRSILCCLPERGCFSWCCSTSLGCPGPGLYELMEDGLRLLRQYTQ